MSLMVRLGSAPRSFLYPTFTSKKLRRLICLPRCLALSSGLEYTYTRSYSLADVLHNVKAKMATEGSPGKVAIFKGKGRHLGLPIEWNMTLGSNGEFLENFTGEKFTSTWGSSGVFERNCWETDFAGLTRMMELDDLESCLLTTWLRSGHWLTPPVMSELEIEMQPCDQGNSHNEEKIGTSSLFSKFSPFIQDDKEKITEVQSAAEAQTIDIAVRLKTGKVTVTVRIDRSTWLPVMMLQDLFGDRETWVFRKWQRWGNSKLMYPADVVHSSASGSRHHYITHAVTFAAKQDVNFHPPEISRVPSNFKYDHSVPSAIPAWKTPSCHVLVKPRIDNKEIGYMILDTGASGLVVEKSAADNLGLEKYGELYVSGVSGKVPAQFRRAKRLELGPLTLLDPQFMEMPLPGLVAGACQPVVGIIGYDVFRRSVVEMKPKDKSTHSDSEPNFSVSIYDIDRFSESPKSTSFKWMQLHMITNLPHIKARFSTNGKDVYEGLFMIDTGAGGAFVMFMPRAVAEYCLQRELDSNSRTFVKGVGGNKTASQPVKSGTLAWFEIGEERMTNLPSLFFNGSKMDISVYGSGILCMNMLQSSWLVIDYSRNRMAVLKH